MRWIAARDPIGPGDEPELPIAARGTRRHSSGVRQTPLSPPSRESAPDPCTPALPLVSAPLLAAAVGGLLCLGGCDSDSSPEEIGVTLERHDPDMTLTRFTDACEEVSGTIETHPHCGGMNSCRGFSYDQTTQVYSEHTCQGYNTCTGWTCVLPKDEDAGKT
jgi:hypothetical protein